MKLHYLNWSFFWFLLFLVIGLFVAGELAGTKYQFFGPGSRWWASSRIHNGLETCPPNHVLVLWFPGYPFTHHRFTDEEIREFDLAGATISYGGTDESPGWCESWNTVISVWHNGRSKLTPEQVANVEKILDSMPASNFNGPIEESVSVAINRQGKLQIYHYRFDDDVNFKSLPAPIADLCLGGTPSESYQ